MSVKGKVLIIKFKLYVSWWICQKHENIRKLLILILLLFSVIGATERAPNTPKFQGNIITKESSFSRHTFNTFIM